MNWKAMAAIALTMMVAVPIGLGYILSVEEEETTSWTTTDQYNISDMMLNSTSSYYTRYSVPDNNGVLFLPQFGLQAPVYVATTTTYSSLVQYAALYKTLEINPNPSMADHVDSENPYSYNVMNRPLVLVGYDGSRTSFQTSSNLTLSYINGEVFIGNNHWTGIKYINVSSAHSGDTELAYTELVPTENYADPAQGWGFGSRSGEKVWTNGQQNQSVVMYLSIPASKSIQFGLDSFQEFNLQHLSQGILFTNTLTHESKLVGAYDTVQLVISTDGVTVSGIRSWPTVGTNPALLNSVTYAIDHDEFSNVRFYSSGTAGITARVDYTATASGSFPCTEDYTLNLGALFPDSMMSIKLSSIGIYGESLQVGDDSYNVVDGRITLGSRKVSLKGAVIGFLPDEEGNIVGKINEFTLGTWEEIPDITFDGEWSLTTIAYKVEETTETNMTWQPGGFGLDREGFAAAGLITAGGVFVMLGMTGRMSGSKALLLAVICGASAFAYFSFL